MNHFSKLLVPRQCVSLQVLNNFSWKPQNYVSTHAFQSSAVASASQDNASARPISEMPGLKIYPIIGSTIDFLFRKDFSSEKFHLFWKSMNEKHGPIFKFAAPLEPPMVAVTLPDDIEKVFRVTMNNPIREGFHALKKIRMETADNYFENKGGLLTENFEEWWRVRSKVQTPMMKPKNIIKFLPQLDEVTLQFMDIIEKHQQISGEMPANFLDEIYKWALEAVGLAALNRRLGCLEPNLSPESTPLQLIKTVNIMFQSLHTTEIDIAWWKLFPTPAYRNLKKSHEYFLRIADENIRQSEAELISKKSEFKGELTLLESLLQTEGLSRKDVITVILDMLFAGIDTTSHTLGFTLYLLARNPNAQKRLQEELDSVLGDGKESINEKHLNRLSYLKACVKESFRIFPIVLGSIRLLETDTVLGGYKVPSGYQVFTMNYLASVNESVFPRAKEFIPERWGRDKPLGPIHPFAFLPFSHGTRMCIGRRIAEQEIYVFLARALHRFHVDYKYEDIDIYTRLIAVPSKPLKFQFIERR